MSMFTSHGQRIPFSGTSIAEGTTTEIFVDCGGVYRCKTCNEEAATVLGHSLELLSDECKLDFTKRVVLRMRGDVVGEAKIRIDHGEIVITAQIDPSSRLGIKLMSAGTSIPLD